MRRKESVTATVGVVSNSNSAVVEPRLIPHGRRRYNQHGTLQVDMRRRVYYAMVTKIIFQQVKILTFISLVSDTIDHPYT